MLKSKQGVFEEASRISGYLEEESVIRGCPDADCVNSAVDVSAGSFHYHKTGATEIKSKRYRCKVCGKIAGSSIHSQVQTSQRRVFATWPTGMITMKNIWLEFISGRVFIKLTVFLTRFVIELRHWTARKNQWETRGVAIRNTSSTNPEPGRSFWTCFAYITTIT